MSTTQTPKTLDQATQKLIEGFTGQVQVCETNVSLGLSRKKYGLAKTGGAFGREPAQPIATGDPKFDLYANALPKFMRQWAAATAQDVRKLYKEYRDLGREGMETKYSEVVAKYQAGN